MSPIHAPTHAMVLAAGLGTRMAPLSTLLPKPALPVLNRPLIAHTLTRLNDHGVTHAVVNAHHIPDRLKQAVETWAPEGLEVTWSHEPKILGTAGGLRRAARHFPDAPIYMVNSDCLSDVDFTAAAEAHAASGRQATMVVRPWKKGSGYRPVLTGTLKRNGTARLTGIGTRRWGRAAAVPRIFTGVHVLAPEVIEAIPRGIACDINADVYPRLIDRDADAVGTWLHKGWWLEAGTPRAYLDLNLKMLARDGRSAIVGPGFFIDEDARVTRSVLGDQVRLERNVVVEESVVWSGVTAGPGVVVRRCVIADGIDLPDGASFEGSIVMKGKDGSIVVEPIEPMPPPSEAPARARIKAKTRPRRRAVAARAARGGVARGGARRRKGR